ncbi:TetR family transcriptional regulator [Nocardia nova]|uniref:TetR family transcriptional regulator n=1 Tax=Nocardia nova TaxID=37330 RepID=A0A2S6APE7_9NOCA|nr:TetR/AcrR family transcriptional regulator [Nocardia nova]PPJ27901.1 TetR family transcriptional regulator [Nocardia nova]PPJ37147.1 TetR family transcriptional regulator [Nocardia nova]
MTVQERKERERAQRRQAIIDSARELAESDGWDAVTVRRLAERIEYSQPVLYSHFSGKRAIVSAVAEEGIALLRDVLRDAREQADGPDAAMEAVARAYLHFAADNPALYDAMFVQDTELPFGPDAPQTLRDCFEELERLFRPRVPEDESGAYTEVFWSALHGMAALDRSARLRPDLWEQRMHVLMRWGTRS